MALGFPSLYADLTLLFSAWHLATSPLSSVFRGFLALSLRSKPPVSCGSGRRSRYSGGIIASYEDFLWSHSLSPYPKCKYLTWTVTLQEFTLDFPHLCLHILQGKLINISLFSLGWKFCFCFFFCLLFGMVFKKTEGQKLLYSSILKLVHPYPVILNRRCHGTFLSLPGTRGFVVYMTYCYK